MAERGLSRHPRDGLAYSDTSALQTQPHSGSVTQQYLTGWWQGEAVTPRGVTVSSGPHLVVQQVEVGDDSVLPPSKEVLGDVVQERDEPIGGGIVLGRIRKFLGLPETVPLALGARELEGGVERVTAAGSAPRTSSAPPQQYHNSTRRV